MRKVNFNNIENLEIPDFWVEKALSLPSKLPEKKNVFAIPSFYRKLSYVACFLLVCALSVALFSFVQKRNILPVQYPNMSVTESTKTETLNNSTETKNGIFQKPTSTKSENGIEPTEEDVANNSSTQVPSTPTATQKETIAETYKPTQKPAPSEDETQTQIIKPTDNFVLPDGPGIENEGLCQAIVDSELISSDSLVYCSLELKSDYQYGVESPLAPIKYPADVKFQSDGKVRLLFDPLKSESVHTSGDYEFYFYNSDGEVIYKGTIHIVVN